jgi:hypothetical protein
MDRTTEIRELTDRFTLALHTAMVDEIESRLTRAMDQLEAAPAIREAVGIAPRRHRRKAPPQLCPVPKCPNRAAPAFGMLCSKHKDTSKRDVARYRAARRARKAGER